MRGDTISSRSASWVPTKVTSDVSDVLPSKLFYTSRPLVNLGAGSAIQSRHVQPDVAAHKRKERESKPHVTLMDWEGAHEAPPPRDL